MLNLKNGKLTGSPPDSVSNRIVSDLQKNASMLSSFLRYFSSSAVLVPVPTASLPNEGSLWVPFQLATALVEKGLGSRVATLLSRTRAVPKAAYSKAKDRLTAEGQYSSMAVQKDLGPVSEITLIDDIVTRGDTLLGAANRLADAYPDAPVRAFAGMRTMTNPDEFVKILDPRTGGWITLQADGHGLRRP